MARERVRTSLNLIGLPLLRADVEAGRTLWSAGREVARVALPETEEEWLDATARLTVRQVEEMLVGREPGDRPSTERADPTTYALTPLGGAEMAAFRARKQEIEEDIGRQLTDGQAVALMAEQSRAPATPASKPPQRPPVMMLNCESCGKGWDVGTGKRIAIDEAAVFQRICDPKIWGASPEILARCHGLEIPADLRRKVWARDVGHCQVPWCRNHRHVEIHHIIELWNGGTHVLDNLVCLCSAHHHAYHRGLLTITGVPSTGMRFEDAWRRKEVDVPRGTSVAA